MFKTGAAPFSAPGARTLHNHPRGIPFRAGAKERKDRPHQDSEEERAQLLLVLQCQSFLEKRNISVTWRLRTGEKGPFEALAAQGPLLS